MNQDQRKYLIEQVTNTFRDQRDKIKSEMPEQPSLNNYLIAAFLDNSIQFNDIKKLKEKIRKFVLKMGHSDILIKENSRWDDNKKECRIEIDPFDLFIIPKNYLDALNEYKKKKKEIDDAIDSLEATKKTIIMKIQIGSNQVLDKLVTQVDNMGDLNIMNSKFLLEDKSKS